MLYILLYLTNGIQISFEGLLSPWNCQTSDSKAFTISGSVQDVLKRLFLLCLESSVADYHQVTVISDLTFDNIQMQVGSSVHMQLARKQIVFMKKRLLV